MTDERVEQATTAVLTAGAVVAGVTAAVCALRGDQLPAVILAGWCLALVVILVFQWDSMKSRRAVRAALAERDAARCRPVPGGVDGLYKTAVEQNRVRPSGGS